MAVEMEFCLLGPMTVRRDGVPVPVARGNQRAVLATLLLRANEPVRVADLAEVLWGADSPPSVRVTVQNYVKRLRRTLGEDGQDRIRTMPHGYLIEVDAGEVDVSRFAALTARARSSAREGSWEQASAQAGSALSLWRGKPLGDVESEALTQKEVPRLMEIRLQALETRLDAELHLGGHADVIPELQHLTDANPTHENLHALLMLALYRCGRQAEALAVYRRLREVLIADLGAEPTTQTRDLHHQILTGDPALAVPAPPSVPTGRVPMVPRELPAAVPDFIGRDTELSVLTRLAEEATRGTVVISAIGGTAGVGKTALALHFAHRVADLFPDGQLYANLRGFAPSGAPATPAEVIRGFLDVLGVPPERIPPTADAQAGLYRSLLSERKMLIVLDNARDEQQVRPLLPASPASLVVVTSRSQLSGLATTNGARLVSLDVLTHTEAMRLVAARIGSTRTAAEPAAIEEIAALCACLPLALAVAAARAAASPRFPLTTLAAELRRAADRLDALDSGDPAVSVRAVFSWSYRQLSDDAARMFRLLGLHPGPDISVCAAASLSAVDEAQARRLLRELARDCLITEHAPGRYAFHDLLRAYAASQAADCDSEPDRDAAIGRVLDHYLHTAARAADLLGRRESPLALGAPRPGAVLGQPADHGQAMAWFEAEHHVLLAVVAFAAETGADHHAWQLPWVMKEYLRRGGYPHERATIFGAALAAAERLHDVPGQAMVLRALGNACTDTGKYDQARAHLERCIVLYQRLGDHMGQAWAQHNLSTLAEARGRYADALKHNEQALRLVQLIGDEPGEAEILGNVGWFHALLGDYHQARTFCEKSLAVSAKLGGCDFDHAVWDTLGYVELQLGDLAQACAHLEHALGLCRNYSDRYTEAEILTHLGDARHAAAELPQARQAWQQALTIYDDLQHHDAGKVRAKLASLDG